MVGIYFSGTGNTKYCIETFVKELDSSSQCFSIEESAVLDAIETSDLIVIAYPIYFSNIPKIMRDFILRHQTKFANKNVFIIATMGLFSGDGTGCSARILRKCGAKIIGGLHIKMPDCICDEKLLKKTIEQNKAIVKQAEIKIKQAVVKLKNKQAPQEGIGFFCHLLGLFGQRLWFYQKTKSYSDKIKIHENKCIGCGLCVQLCPMHNLFIAKHVVSQRNQCTMCYRCVNSCPQQAITLLGKNTHEQCNIKKYL